MKQKELLDFMQQLHHEEMDLVSRVINGIRTQASYFEIFHIAFADLLTNRYPSEKERLMQKPVYQILESIVEDYRNDPGGYR